MRLEAGNGPYTPDKRTAHSFLKRCYVQSLLCNLVLVLNTKFKSLKINIYF